MLVSVIITTKNEEKNIQNCLNSVMQQTFPQGEIEMIVVDNSSTDGTKEIARKYTEKVFDWGPERSAQRNFGVGKSSGKYILYLDADMTLSSDVIRECVEKMENNDKIVAMYIPEVIRGNSLLSRVRKFERNFYNGTAIDATRFMRREAFMQAGGFDEKLYACEDWDLDKRIKKLGNFETSKECLYHHEEDLNLKKYMEKKKYYSKNVDVYIGKWGINDPDVKKQFGITYRFAGVFLEKGKWKTLLRHPFLSAGMYFLKFLVGLKFLMRNI